MKRKIIIIFLAIILILTGYFIRGVMQKDAELIFSNKDALYSIGLNQYYINKITKELVKQGNVENLKCLISMIAYSRDLDSFGKLSRYIANTNNDYSILFLEFKGLSGEYLDYLRKIDIDQIKNFTSDDIIYLEEYIKIGEVITGIIDSLMRDEYYKSGNIIELILRIRDLRT